VRSADVTFDPPEAIVTYEKGLVTIDQMMQAVAKYGFTASLKGRKPG
jgi:copper chaperone CopZ